MSENASLTQECERILAELDETTCQYCSGELSIGSYKDTPAILCGDCETPAVRVW